MTVTAEATAFLAAPPADDPLVKRGRYQIVPADGEKVKPHTRITNYAKKLEDEYNLTKWKMRSVLLGAAQRSDIVIAALANSDDSRELDNLTEAAMDAAKANVKRETGTALHRLIERIDGGEALELPEPWRSDVDAYARCLEAVGAEVELIEEVVVYPSLGLAGRLDRTVIRDGVRYIADLKTGTDLKYSWGSIAMQLALYAGAATIYDPEKKTHRPMPEVDQARALVIHLPAGSGVATAYWVNLEEGRRGIAIVGELLEWRKRARTFAAATFETAAWAAAPELRAYVVDRVRYVIESGYGAELAAAWPEGVPTLKAYENHTEPQLDLVLFECSEIEGRHRLAFMDLTDPRN